MVIDPGGEADRIVEMLRANPQIRLESVANQLDISVRTVKSVIASLEVDGIITRKNGKRYGYWEVNK